MTKHRLQHTTGFRQMVYKIRLHFRWNIVPMTWVLLDKISSRVCLRREKGEEVDDTLHFSTISGIWDTSLSCRHVSQIITLSQEHVFSSTKFWYWQFFMWKWYRWGSPLIFQGGRGLISPPNPYTPYLAGPKNCLKNIPDMTCRGRF